ncbi:MAG: hypothetical protein U0324_31130 [Polyangiales bacterium]
MTPSRAALWLLVGGITVASGLADAQGFLHAARVWRGGRLVEGELLRAVAGFAVGISLYLVGLRFQTELGIRAPEVQTVSWFGVTLVGVALWSGRFAAWRPVDQAVAVGVLVGIAWLLLRTGE